MKIFYTFLFCIALIPGFSQTDFDLSPNPSHASDSAEEDDFSANATIKNLTEHTIVVAWQRIENDIPEGWQSYLCSNITCAPPDISMGTFSITAFDSTNLDCHFVPHDIAGSGTVEFRLFLTDDTTQVIYATYTGDALPVSTETLQTPEEIRLYPNPAEELIFIENVEPPHIVKVYGYNGSMVAEFRNQTEIPIEDLPPGIYVLALFTQDNKLLSAHSFQKVIGK